MFFIWQFFRENVFALFWWFPTQYYYFGYCDLMFVLHFGCFWMNLLTFWVALILITLRELRWNEPIHFGHVFKNKNIEFSINSFDFESMNDSICEFDFAYDIHRYLWRILNIFVYIVIFNFYFRLGSTLIRSERAPHFLDCSVEQKTEHFRISKFHRGNLLDHIQNRVRFTEKGRGLFFSSFRGK